jgi:acetyl esterase/lipase
MATAGRFSGAWNRGFIGLVLLCLAVSSLRADDPKTELLWPAGAPGALGSEEKDQPKLIIYLAPKEKATGVGIVVCPGGGYGGLAIGHEGHEIAQWLNSLGISAFICDYRHRGKGYGHPAPSQDAGRAIRIVRSRAEEFGVDSKRIGVIGFSAGGHLASTVSTHFGAGQTDDADPIQRVSSRPDFAILCYPVIAFGESFTHGGSQRNLLGENADPELVKKFSNEKQVTANNPPTFIWHTSDDAVVAVENAIVFYSALHRAGVPAELHVYETGRHGLGLAKGIPGAENWPQELADWLKVRGLLNSQ